MQHERLCHPQSPQTGAYRIYHATLSTTVSSNNYLQGVERWTKYRKCTRCALMTILMNKILLSASCMCIYRTYPRGGRWRGEGDINNSLVYQSISPHSYLFQPAQPGSSTQQTKSCHLGPGLVWSRLGRPSDIGAL